MSDVRLQIDGTQLQARAGTTVLEAARAAGIAIPTLCHHPALAPFGACRLCIVEAEAPGAGEPRILVSCVAPVEPGLALRTRSPRIDRLRRALLELLLAHAPHAPRLVQLGREYGADPERFAKAASFCVVCGLCVRYCAEVKQKHAVGFIDRGTRKEISFVPEIAARECTRCKACFPLCPTSYLQAAFVLTESLAFPSRS
jgi:NADH dehydrogenase/NADH:ubiquinone oxidoreductase subunit G